MTKEECVALLYRYANYNGIGIPNLERCKEAMKMAADLLSKPSLPSELDEAELKHVEVSDYPPANQEEELMVYNAFKAGAEWQIEQFEKNRLAACDAQTKEEYDMETAFVDKIIKEQLRTPTFSDAIKHGIEWMAGQGVTKEAVIGMATEEIFINVSKQALDDLDLRPGDEVIVQIRKK